MAGREKNNKPSMKDVAELAGVSTATVSHVINGTRYVSEEVCEKVQSAMKTLNYVPNPIARSLRSQQSHLIGLIIPVKASSDMANLFFMTIAQGVESILTKNGYKMILCNSYEDLQVEKDLLRMFNAQLVDGVILAPVAQKLDDLSDVLIGQYPLVAIDRKIQSFTGDCVESDNFQGGYEATSHLLEKGHKRIGFISSDLNITSAYNRYKGYCQALLDNGLSVEKEWVKIGNGTFEEGFRLAGELADATDVSALFIANNTMTPGALSYFYQQKIGIPDEMAVVGFDDYEILKVLNPPLTCVKQPAYEMGVKAAEVLLARIKAEKQGAGCDYVLPTSLVVRQST